MCHYRDYRASFIPVQDLYNITNEESIELFNGINDYLKSGLLDADPEASEEQVLNIEAIIYEYYNCSFIRVVTIVKKCFT